jgi:hypothetical protein
VQQLAVVAITELHGAASGKLSQPTPAVRSGDRNIIDCHEYIAFGQNAGTGAIGVDITDPRFHGEAMRHPLASRCVDPAPASHAVEEPHTQLTGGSSPLGTPLVLGYGGRCETCHQDQHEPLGLQ